MDHTATQSKSRMKQSASGGSQGEIRPVEDAIEYFRNFAQEKPEQAALWCLGIGFVLGWKLKPW